MQLIGFGGSTVSGPTDEFVACVIVVALMNPAFLLKASSADISGVGDADLLHLS